MSNWPRATPFAPAIEFVVLLAAVWAFRHFVCDLPIVALEITLLVSGVAATAVAADALIDSWYDLNVHIDSRINGTRLVVAQDDVTRDVLRLLAGGVAMVVGIWSVFLPADMDGVALVFKHGMLFMTWLVLFVGVAERINRRRLLWTALRGAIRVDP